VDNLEARIRLNLLCQLGETDLYNLGIDSQFITAEFFPFSSPEPCACLQCSLPSSAYDKIAQRYSCGALRKIAFEENMVPTTSITASLAGATAVSLLLHGLHGRTFQMSASSRYFQDTISLQSTLSSIERAPQCMGCLPADRLILRTSAKRSMVPDPFIPLPTETPVQISLSDPVLLATDCQICSHHRDYLDIASRYSDALLTCQSCGASAVKPTILDRLDVPAFIKQFGCRTIPCKFITLVTASQITVVELED
jgi:hypothetical protein